MNEWVKTLSFVKSWYNSKGENVMAAYAYKRSELNRIVYILRCKLCWSIEIGNEILVDNSSRIMYSKDV